jgi:hypothetical protein
LDLNRLTGDLYYYQRKGNTLRDANGNIRNWHPKIEHKMLCKHHSSIDEILYIALPMQADFNNLTKDDFLYIGCSKDGGGRYWRGKINETTKFPIGKSCFHHQQMRKGRDGCLESYLSDGVKVRVYTLTSDDVTKIVSKHNIQLLHGNYPAHQLETKILSEGFTKWKWNSKS